MPNPPVAIVTGGAQGLGEEICKVLLKEGYKVCVADIQRSKAKKFIEEQNEKHGSERVIFSYCDVTKESDFKNTFDLTISAFNRVDVLVNNAGVVQEKEPRKVVNVNVLGPINGCKAALKYMGKSKGGRGGVVINVASMLGLVPYSALPVYSATKHAVIGLTRSYGLPHHLLKEGIIFSALCPFCMRTPMLNDIMNYSLMEQLNASEMPGILNPDYVAGGVTKLLEDKINGSVLLITQDHGYQYIGLQECLKTIKLE